MSTPFPSDIHRIAYGVSAYDANNGYYLGGIGSWKTSLGLPEEQWISTPGLLIFDFDKLTLKNSSDDGFSQNAGAMIDIPIYGDDGVLVVLPDANAQSDQIGFDHITLYDKKTMKRYSQYTTGNIPQIRTHFCAVGIQGDEAPFYE
ncbi:hypothetical protein MMC07_008440, partial [Pseudocyphellaria aurata]|nr:hypothetical protein [Pseudocyphellaria aurata]